MSHRFYFCLEITNFAARKKRLNVKIRLYILFITVQLLCANTLRAQRADSLAMQFIREMGVTATTDNGLKLFLSGEAKFIDLFQAIRQAKHHIHLEYFNFRNDSIANTLFDLLAVKAAEGVEVRAMFDSFGNSSNNRPLKREHIEAIRSKGIELVKFDPMRFPWVNHALHRDHRKIVVIDGQVGYTGGMNIADYYIHGLPEIGDWRDIHLRIEGSAVHQLQGIFLTMWNKETGQHVGGPDYFPTLPAEADSTLRQLPHHDAEVMVVDRTPGETSKSIRQAYAACIASAQQHIQIVNPYFVPTRTVRKAIKKALKQGKRVEIMIPLKSDIPFTPEASHYIAHKLMKRGAEVYLFEGGFHHSKIMMIDSTFCTVGTANLNSRSLCYDYETNAFIFDPRPTAELSAMFERDKLTSTPLTREYWKHHSRWKKFLGWLGNVLTPFL